MNRPSTLGELAAAGYRTRSVKDEVRNNVRAAVAEGRRLFPGIVGYDRTVIPSIVNALLARHDIVLLGLRGQAKTRILRSLVSFLDVRIPALEGAPLNDDPFAPVSPEGRRLVEERGDDAPIVWIPRERRYQE